MPTVAELTISSLRHYADDLAEQDNIPRSGVLRRAVHNVLAASSYLDTDRLIDLDFEELDQMLATTRPDLSDNSRSTYLGQLKRVAQMLLDQTAAHHGGTAVVLTRRANPAGRQGLRATTAAPGQRAAPPEPAAAASATPMLTFPFPLRPTLTIALALPADLTSDEADRLAQMIKLLPVGSR